MDIDIKELIRAASEALDLSHFKGDVVGVKVVENEFGNIEPGGIGIQVNNGRETPRDGTDGGQAVDIATVAKAVQKCKPFMWGNAALATVFCVCRDCYGMGSNMSRFERLLQEQGIACPAGTLAAAMQNNPYMKFPVGKWKDNGAKERALVLAREFRKSVDETLADTPAGQEPS